MTLSNNVTTVTVSYDEVGETVTVSGNQYAVGDAFILDGKKVTVRGS